MPGEPPAPREPAGNFATTRWSLVLDAGAAGSEACDRALEELCRAYWPPIHGYLCRSGHSPDDAKDLTQQFFSNLLEKRWLVRADRERGRFRSFLLTYLKGFLADHRDRGAALKRGGGREVLSLEDLAGEEYDTLEQVRDLSPEREFDRRWALATLGRAHARLRAEAEQAGLGDLFEAGQSHLVQDCPEESLRAIASRFGLGESALKMRLKRWRTRYQDLIRAEVADTVPRLADVTAELRHLLDALTY